MNPRQFFKISWLVVMSVMMNACGFSIRQAATATSADTGFVNINVLPQFSAAPNWNDYVRVVSPSTPCDGTELSNALRVCIHGGDKKQVVVPGYTSCAGLNASDSLGAFDWRCDATSGTAIFYSNLKDTAGLKDLLITSGWLNNSVTVMNGATTVGVSAPSAWWSNLIAEAPNNQAGVQTALSTPGQIYTVSSTHGTRGYTIGADKIALVVMGGVTLQSTIGANNCSTASGAPGGAGDEAVMVCIAPKKFLWIEGRFDGVTPVSTNHAILAYGVTHSIFRKVYTSNAPNALSYSGGIFLGGGSNNNKILLSHIDSGRSGVTVINSKFNTLAQLEVANTYNYGIGLVAATDNSISRSLSTNAYIAIAVDTSNARNTTVGVTFGNSSGAYSLLNAGNNHNTLSLALAANTTAGIYYFNQGDNDTYSESAFVDEHTLQGIQVNLNNGKFTGNIISANNSTNCQVNGGANPGITAACANQGLSNATFSQNVIYTSGGTFAGKVSDSVNTTNVAGSAAYATTLDFFGFLNPLRSWGVQGSPAFPNSDQINACTGAATCHIWDWSLKATDTLFRNFHGAFTPGICPVSLTAPANILTDQNGVTYLSNAIELVGKDYPGNNDNGLCEAGETCLYAPNFGAYQGHGPLSQCSIPSGPYAGTTIYGYTINGR